MSTYRAVRRKLKKSFRIISTRLSAIAPDGILPYSERPSNSRSTPVKPDVQVEKRMEAHDLFSRFTADIIHEDIVYAR